MSEAIGIANLVLGIVGTVTGSIAIIIHYWRLRRENPRLEVKVLECMHDFEISPRQVKTISFWTTFEIRNLGDRGTTVNEIELDFLDNGREYRFKKQYFRGLRTESESRWINAHEIINIDADFYDRFEGNDREQIECTFTIYHTHGAKTAQCISNTRRESVRET